MSATAAAATQLIALAAGALLVTSVLVVWRRELSAQVRLLTVQGVSLAALAVTIGLAGPGSARAELLVVAVLVLVLRAWLLPWVLGRRLRAGQGRLTARRTPPRTVRRVRRDLRAVSGRAAR